MSIIHDHAGIARELRRLQGKPEPKPQPIVDGHLVAPDTYAKMLRDLGIWRPAQKDDGA